MNRFALSLVAVATADIAKGDAKKAAMHGIRRTVAQSAIDACLRGNKTQYLQAQALVQSAKGTIAKAYRAAFDAVPAPEKFAYTGKLSADVAQQIETRAAELAQQWSDAFVAVAPLTSAEKTEEEQAKAKADKEAKAKAKALEVATAEGWAPKAPELGMSELTDKVIQLIQSGQLGADNIAMLHKASGAAMQAAKATAKAASKQPA